MYSRKQVPVTDLQSSFSFIVCQLSFNLLFLPGKSFLALSKIGTGLYSTAHECLGSALQLHSKKVVSSISAWDCVGFDPLQALQPPEAHQANCHV